MYKIGTKLKQIVEPIKRNISIDALYDKTIAIDAFNYIYQFLSIIKGKNGKPLTNFRGKITSHLIGLFYRNTNFLENRITPIYCFDGLEKSKKIRWKNKSNNKIKITKELIESCKSLLDLMGINWIQGKGEGEAQCAELIKKKEVFAVASQDYDCLCFGSNRLIRNLGFSGNKKHKNTTIKIKIEYISLEKLLNNYQIDLIDLIDYSILVGNDWFKGLKGYGEKNALKVFDKTFSIETMSKDLQMKDGTKIKHSDFVEKIKTLRNQFINPKINNDYTLKKKIPNLDGLYDFLVNENNFSPIRIKNTMDKLVKLNMNTKKQTTLSKFF